VSEMVAANPRLWGTDKSRRRSARRSAPPHPHDRFAGADPQLLADAARYNVDRGAQIIDINMGCPAKKVCNAAAGSALLANEPLVARIVATVVGAVDVPVTLKIRTGPTPRERDARDGDRFTARMPVRGARRVRHGARGEARRAHSGIRERRHRNAAGRSRHPRLYGRRRPDDRPCGAGTAVDLPRDRPLRRDGRNAARTDGRRGARRDPRASRRSLRVLRRDPGRSHCAQAPALVYGAVAGRCAIPARDQRGRIGRRADRRRRAVLRATRGRRRMFELRLGGGGASSVRWTNTSAGSTASRRMASTTW
jgi:hypothetical protein